MYSKNTAEHKTSSTNNNPRFFQKEKKNPLPPLSNTVSLKDCSDDIIAYIFAFVAKDPKTLKNLAQTCKAFNELIRKLYTNHYRAQRFSWFYDKDLQRLQQDLDNLKQEIAKKISEETANEKGNAMINPPEPLHNVLWPVFHYTVKTMPILAIAIVAYILYPMLLQEEPVTKQQWETLIKTVITAASSAILSVISAKIIQEILNNHTDSQLTYNQNMPLQHTRFRTTILVEFNKFLAQEPLLRNFFDSQLLTNSDTNITYQTCVNEFNNLILQMHQANGALKNCNNNPADPSLDLSGLSQDLQNILKFMLEKWNQDNSDKTIAYSFNPKLS